MSFFKICRSRGAVHHHLISNCPMPGKCFDPHPPNSKTGKNFFRVLFLHTVTFLVFCLVVRLLYSLIIYSIRLLYSLFIHLFITLFVFFSLLLFYCLRLKFILICIYLIIN